MKKISQLCTRAHIKPAFILPLIAVLCLLAAAVLWYAGPKAEAAGAGQVPTAAQEPWTLVNPLGDRITRIPEILVDPSETATLQNLFADSIGAAAAARSTLSTSVSMTDRGENKKRVSGS